MRLIRFDGGAGPRAGVLGDRGVVDLTAAGVLADDDPIPAAMDPAVRARALAALAHGPWLEPAGLRRLAPVRRPGKILGVGLNYRDHARETGREPPTVQMWFNKQSSSIHDPGAPVLSPAVSDQLDYEVELVVVIGRRGRHVPRERAGEIIAGYAAGCDVSVRDWQRATQTMIMGKGFDTHAPIGPWLMTADEAGPVDAMRLTCRVNGEVRQDASAAEMIFGVAEQIEHLTKAFPLEPGDLLFTGTPAGVGAARTPPDFLKAGDRVDLHVEPVGGFGFVVEKEAAVCRIG